MSFTDQQKAALAADLDRRKVKQREAGNFKVSYIEGWHAIAEANRIFGFDAWSSETVLLQAVVAKEASWERWKKGERGVKETVHGHVVTYIAKVRVSVAGIFREGTGSGHGKDVDLGTAHESAIKEAETDARKRALMTFGNPFGLALYDKAQENVSTNVPDAMADDTEKGAAPTTPAAAIKPIAPLEDRPAAPSKPTTSQRAIAASRKPAEQRPAPETYKTMARKQTSAEAAKKLLEGDSVIPGLITIATDLAAGEKSVEDLESQITHWGSVYGQLKERLTDTEDFNSVQKSFRSLRKALTEEAAIRAKAA